MTIYNDRTITQILQRLKRIQLMDLPDIRRNSRTAYNVRRRGMAGDGVTDDSDAANAIWDLIAAQGWGGEEFYPPGSYVKNAGETVPVNIGAVIRGSGCGWRTAAAKVTKFVTTANRTAAMMTVPRSGGGASPDTARTNLNLSDVWLDGGRGNGFTATAPLLYLAFGSECRLQDVVVRNQADIGAVFGQLYNSVLRSVRFHNCGRTKDAGANIVTNPLGFHPACQFTSFSGGGCNTVHLYDLEFEGNQGTDLQIIGAGLNPCTNMTFHGLKFEGGVGVTEPYLHLAFAELCQVDGLLLENHRTVPPILVEHVSLGDGEDRQNRIYGEIQQNSAVANPTHMIDVQGGSLFFEGEIRADPTTADVRIGANVRPGAVKLRADCFTQAAGGGRRRLTVQDLRAVPEF